MVLRYFALTPWDQAMQTNTEVQVANASLAVQQLMIAYARRFGWSAEVAAAAITKSVGQLYALDKAAQAGKLGEMEGAGVVADVPAESAVDFEMAGDVGSVWVGVDNMSIYIRRTDDGVVVDAFAKGAEDICLATLGVMHQEAEEALSESLGVDLDAVSEQLGSEFGDATPERRAEMIQNHARRSLEHEQKTAPSQEEGAEA